jgi:hypothetical protein
MNLFLSVAKKIQVISVNIRILRENRKPEGC